MSGRKVQRKMRPRLVLAGVVCTLVGWFLGQAPVGTPGARVWPWLVIIGVGLVVGVVVDVWRRHAGSAGLVRWWSWRSRRNAGVASRWDILRRASRWAMKPKAAILRPSLRRVPFWRRWLVPTGEYAARIARVGWLVVWSAVEDVVVIIGAPRSGKSALLAGIILDAPGAVIATSTKDDLVTLTSELRAAKGPVRIFNPSGLGGLTSDISFNPVCGCADPGTAIARAQDLLSGSDGLGHGGDMRFWQEQAQRVLAPLLHAAALGNASMREVQGWVANPESSAERVEHLLRRSPEAGMEADAAQFFATNDRTRSSISATIMPALRWLSDATAAVAASGDAGFDVAELLGQRQTVYLLGRNDAQVAPLLAALTGHIAREARRLAAEAPGGRLDPPLTLALDEAALICPVPLDDWSADMGGRGVCLHIAVQSRAQLKQRWGDDGAATILNNTGTLVVFGGIKDTDDLSALSTLAGERYEDVPTFGENGPMRQRVPVLPASRIAGMTAGRVAIFRRNMPVCLGHVRPGWKHPAVRALARQRRWARVRGWLEAAAGRLRSSGETASAVARPKVRAAARRVRDYRSGRGQAPEPVRRIHHNQLGSHTRQGPAERSPTDTEAQREEVRKR
jgi:type IV secretion system protein VirD4